MLNRLNLTELSSWMRNPANNLAKRDFFAFCQESIEAESATLDVLAEILSYQEYTRRRKRISDVNSILAMIRTLC